MCCLNLELRDMKARYSYLVPHPPIVTILRDLQTHTKQYPYYIN